MTIQADFYAVADYGNGATTAFTLPWPFRAQSDVVVQLLDTNGVPVVPAPVLNGTGTYDYTITGTPDPDTGFYPTGSVVFRTAPPTGYTAYRSRATKDWQDKSLPTNGRFPAKSVEAALDRRTLVDQEQDYLFGHLGGTGGGGGPSNGRIVMMSPYDLSTFSPILPPTVGSAGFVLAQKADGSGFQWIDLSKGGTQILQINGTANQITVTGPSPAGVITLSLPTNINVTVPVAGQMKQAWVNSSPSGLAASSIVAANDLYSECGVQMLSSTYGDARFGHDCGLVYSTGAGGVVLGTGLASPIRFMVNWGEVARFSNAGYLGIGEQNPTRPLCITGSINGDVSAVIANNSGGNNAIAEYIAVNNAGHNVSLGVYGSGVSFGELAVLVTNNPGGLLLSVPANASEIFQIGGAEIARFAANGNLGIGTGSPAGTCAIDIARNNNGNAQIEIINANAGAAALTQIRAGNNAGHIVTMYMLGSGFATSGVSVADGGIVMCDGAGGLTVGTNANAPLVFMIWAAEYARLSRDATTGNPAFCVNRTAGFQAAGITVQNSNNGLPVLEAVCTHATGARGQFIYFGTAINNGSFGNAMLTMYDPGGTRAWFPCNGGLANFQANNTNISDARLKHQIEHLKAPMLAKLWDAHRDMAWSRYKYRDQRHDDFNYGYTAQDIAKSFGEVVDLIETWDDDGALDPETMEMVRKPASHLAVYSEDLHSIGHALLSEAQRRIEKLEAALAALTKEKRK